MAQAIKSISPIKAAFTNFFFSTSFTGSKPSSSSARSIKEFHYEITQLGRETNQVAVRT
jgi:hypothetical protein